MDKGHVCGNNYLGLTWAEKFKYVSGVLQVPQGNDIEYGFRATLDDHGGNWINWFLFNTFEEAKGARKSLLRWVRERKKSN